MSLTLLALADDTPATDLGLGLAYPLRVVLEDPAEVLTAGDGYPLIVGQLLQATDEPVDLTTALSVTFLSATVPDGRELANAPAEITDAANGQFKYSPLPGDFYLASGKVLFVIRLQFPTGRQTVPSTGPAQLTLAASL